MTIKRLTVQYTWAEIEGEFVVEKDNQTIDIGCARMFWNKPGRLRPRIRVLGSMDGVGVKNAPNELLAAHLQSLGFQRTEIYYLDEHICEILL